MIKSAIFEPNLLNMCPKSILLLITLFLCSLTVSAQYTEKINTNRPGTSQGAFSVGNNVLQLEGGFGFGKEKHKLLNTKTNVFKFDYSVRYGLLIEQLELRLNGTFRADGVRQTIGGNEEKIKRSNFEVNTIGAKYLIYDPYKRPKKDSTNYDELKSWKERYRFKWKSLIPAVSAYVGANFVSKDNPFTAPNDDTFSPKIVLMTQNNWTTSLNGNWVLVTNLIVDKVTTDDPIIGWIITSTHAINEKWAAFGEYQGQKSDFYSDNILRLGGAYLYNKDLQLDANIAFNFKDTPSIFTFSFGASYRFDWHTKDEIIEQPGLEGGIKDGEKEENKGEGENDEENEDEFDDREEGEENENDSLKLETTPFVNDFEDDSLREGIEKDLDERRTAERLERERIENEKIAKKEGKKFKKEEARRLKREAKEARKAEKAEIQAEKEKQKMIDDIDAELDKMEKQQGVDQELQDIDKELQELEKMEKELDSDNKEKEEKKQEEKEEKKQEEDVDAEYEKYQKEQEKNKKAEEKRRKKEKKKRQKEEKKRKKEEQKRKNKEEKDNKTDDSDLDKELEKIDQ
ncbi:transporter [Aquimarina sp. Aq78]|uniref:transporter n=1 Tax=Aquimarina sp. Aq78 TaxID=1191889 RepID=UPI001F37B3A2|nr:transporter [Aquimarina sp. Aq78]